MQEENKTEIVELEEAKSTVLNKTKQAMRKSKKKILFSKICSISIPILVAILLIGYPIIMHSINSGETYSRTWKNMIRSANVEYTELTKEKSKSIKELNIEENGQFYWIDNAEITESFVLKQDNQIIVIEEHYNYDGIECVLYITNQNSKVNGISVDSEFSLNTYNDYFFTEYTIVESNTYGKFLMHYKYQFKINSTDTSTIEIILSNLTNS